MDDQDEFEVIVRAPEGTSLQKTLEISQQVAADIRELKHIDYTLTTIGDDQQRTQNLASIYVKLVDVGRPPDFAVRDHGAGAREGAAEVRLIQPAGDSFAGCGH